MNQRVWRRKPFPYRWGQRQRRPGLRNISFFYTENIRRDYTLYGGLDYLLLFTLIPLVSKYFNHLIREENIDCEISHLAWAFFRGRKWETQKLQWWYDSSHIAHLHCRGIIFPFLLSFIFYPFHFSKVISNRRLLSRCYSIRRLRWLRLFSENWRARHKSAVHVTVRGRAWQKGHRRVK